MTKDELASYAARLDATDLSFASDTRDRSGNRIGLVDIEWDAAILRIMATLGWRITDSGDVPTMKLTLMDSEEETR